MVIGVMSIALIVVVVMVGIFVRDRVATRIEAAGALISDVPVTRSIFLLIFNPIMEGYGSGGNLNPKLSQLYSSFGWGDPDSLNGQIVPTFNQVSHGYLNYNVTGRMEVDGFPVKADSFTYTDSSYKACVDSIIPSGGSACHVPDLINYQTIASSYDFCGRNVDEVWIWGGPYFGFLEHNMISCGTRTVFVMGFNYERSHAEALHNFGHRMEFVGNMSVGDGSWIWSDRATWNEANEFNKFVNDKHCGWMHYGPGAVANNLGEYIYNNPVNFISDCNSYLNYPNGPFVNETLNCTVWGCDREGFEKWWFLRVPSGTGTKTVSNGSKLIYNNWWKYFANYDMTRSISGLFSNLTAELADGQATFNFNYSGATEKFHVELSTTSGMTTDVYFDFGVGTTNPVIVTNPHKWNKYVCGTTLYWTVRTETGEKSPIQSMVVCSPPPLYVVSPTNNSTVASLRPTIEWPDISGATSYIFQISTVSTFATMLVNTTTTNSSYIPTVDLPKNVPLYWRVSYTTNCGAGCSGGGGIGTFSFISANPPTIPTLLTPATGVVSTTMTPTLTWSAPTVAPLATRYQVQISTVSTFATTVLDNSTVPTNSLVVSPTLPANTTYYWRVRSYSANGHYSSWSTAFTLKTSLAMPGLTLPTNGATNVLVTRPIFDWNDVIGATGYTIQVSTVNTFATFLVNATTLTATSTYTPTIDLTKNVILYWRVRANGGLGASVFSNVFSFTSANPPTIPTLLTPATGVVSTTMTPTLTWSAPTVAPLATRYQVQISTVSTFATTVLDVSNVTTNSFVNDLSMNSSAVLLTPNTTYYWRARSFAANNHYSNWSTSFILKTSLATPTLSLPTNWATDVLTTRPTFDWGDVAGATGYTIQASTSNEFLTFIFNVSILTSTSTYTPGVDLPKNVYIFWRVRANGGLGSSEYGYSYFTSANPPTIPTLLTPATGVVSTTMTPTLTWSAPTVAPLATRYQVQISTVSTFATTVLDNSTVPTNSLVVSPTLPANTTYYWRVRSYSANGHYSSWSTAFTLKTSLAMATLIYPILAVTDVPVRPVFDWSDVVGATGYTIQVSPDKTFTTMTINATILTPTSTYIPTVNLTLDTTYFWRVRANGGLGASAFTQLTYFTVMAPPNF